MPNLTSLLDLVGALAVIAGVAWLVGVLTGVPALGLIVFGVGLLVLSWLVDRRVAGPRPAIGKGRR